MKLRNTILIIALSMSGRRAFREEFFMLRRTATLALSTTFLTGLAMAEVPHQLSGWASQSSTLRTPGPVSGRFATAANGVVLERSAGRTVPSESA